MEREGLTLEQVTMGNPLYIRETLDQLLQDGNLKVGWALSLLSWPFGTGRIFL